MAGIGALLLEVGDRADPVEVGDQALYEIRVTNQGSANVTNIRIECTLPEGQQFVSGNGPTQASANGPSVKFAPVESLGAREHVVFRVTVKSTGKGDVRFKVTMTSDQLDTPVTENESTFMY